MRLISQNDLDILRYGFYFLINRMKKKKVFATVTDKVISKEEYKELVFENLLSTEDFSCIWNVIFKKKILGDLRFDSNVKFGEDLLFSYELILRSSNMMILDEPLYNYEYNINGASKCISKDKCLGRLSDEIYVDEHVCNMFSKYIDLGNNTKFRINKFFNYNLKDISKEGYRKYKEYLKEVERLDNKYIDKNNIKKENNFFRYLMYRIYEILKDIKRRG